MGADMKELFDRRGFVKVLGAGTAALALPGCGLVPGGRTRRRRPNLVVLFSDDQRFDTLAALGNHEIRTPHLDGLIKRGTAFTRAHIMGSMHGAVCMPSRAALMTGRTLFHLEKNGGLIPPGHVMLPELLREAGYTTFGTGKWHNGRESFARAFDSGGSIFFGGMHWENLGGHFTPRVHDFDPTGGYPEEKRYVADRFSSTLYSDEAMKFLNEYSGTDPFFLYVSYTAPHDPREAPEEYMKLYDPDRIALPESFLPEHPFDNGEMTVRDEKLAPRPRTPEVVREHIAAYYAMITHLDSQVGRLLETLWKSRHGENTIIVFAGDNGLAVGRHGLLGKQSLYEHSVRVPLVMAGPGIPAGVRSDADCYLHDIYPTLCGLIGLPLPDSVEGRSLLPILRGERDSIRDSVFYAYGKVQRGVRCGRWKLIQYHVKGTRTVQLFDVKDDPFEINNLAGDPGRKDRVRKMTELLREWMRHADDICDPDDPGWCGAPPEG